MRDFLTKFRQVESKDQARAKVTQCGDDTPTGALGRTPSGPPLPNPMTAAEFLEECERRVPAKRALAQAEAESWRSASVIRRSLNRLPNWMPLSKATCRKPRKRWPLLNSEKAIRKERL